MERTVFCHHITIPELLYIVNYRVFTKTTALYRLKLQCTCSMEQTGILCWYRKKPPKFSPT